MSRKMKFWTCWGVEKATLLFLAGFFLWSGWQKLQDLSSFTRSVGNFQFDWKISWSGEERNFFAEPMDAIIAYTAPWLEIVIAASLLLPLTRVAAGVMLAGLLASFNQALRYARDKGIENLKCGCHGVSEESTDYTLKLASNLGLITLVGLVLALIWVQRRLASAEEDSTLPP